MDDREIKIKEVIGIASELLLTCGVCLKDNDRIKILTTLENNIRADPEWPTKNTIHESVVAVGKYQYNRINKMILEAVKAPKPG